LEASLACESAGHLIALRLEATLQAAKHFVFVFNDQNTCDASPLSLIVTGGIVCEY
jgi:hypothetical protein